MYITFENELGSIRITGGGGGTWQLIEAEGLDNVQYDAQTAYMSGREGRVTTAMQSLERSISLKGDIIAKNSSALLTKVAQILGNEGRLKIVSGTKKRMINARCTAFVPERELGGIRPFVMQFICDDPFFTDLDKKELDLATIERLLYGTLDLTDGIVFSTARTSAIITNSGAKRAEPVVAICSLTDTLGDVITLTNHTTEQKLTLNTSLLQGDTLMIDVPNRTVTLNGETRFDILSDDSFLSEFYLDVGNNQVSVTTNRNGDRLVASVDYYNKYNEAMM